MISEVFRKFIDDHKSGLGIVELPTSIGKTFSTFECIAKYTQRWAEYKKTHKRNGDFRQIIVVTPLKKNLQASNKEADELDGLERAVTTVKLAVSSLNESSRTVSIWS